MSVFDPARGGEPRAEVVERMASSTLDLNKLVRHRRDHLARLREINAPDLICEVERQLIAEAEAARELRRSRDSGNGGRKL